MLRKLTQRHHHKNLTKLDANFRQARRFHREGMLSLGDYYSQIINNFKFDEQTNTSASDLTSATLITQMTMIQKRNHTK